MATNKKSILLIAALDTKGAEAEYMKKVIEKMGHKVIVADDGVLDEPQIKADISRHEIANAAGSSIRTLVLQKDEGKASEVMAKGLAKIAQDLYKDGEINGVISIGGSVGTAIASTVMKAVPIGVPKVMVTTMASRDVRPYVGTKDITLVHSVTDIFGLNRISRKILANAAAAVAGMASIDIAEAVKVPLVGISLTGEQFLAAKRIKKNLEDKGYEVVAFHAVGSGGKALEELVKSGEINGGVIDLAIQEVYSNLFDPGGMFDAGLDRLEAAGEVGIPHIIVPGCADFMSFPAGQIPPKFNKYKVHMHNPSLVVVKTEKNEVLKLAGAISEKINKGKGPRAVIIPTEGFSRFDKVDSPAGFYDPETRKEFLAELKKKLDPSVRYVEVNAHINDPEFADALTDVFLEFKGNQMNISIRWCGFDFGGTIIDPRKYYQSTVDLIKEIYTQLGKPEVIDKKLVRFDELLAECGYDERLMDGIEEAHEIEFWKRHYRLKHLRETDIQKFFSYILDNDRDAIELYGKKSVRHLKPADGLKECLTYLKGKGISVNIVSDVESEETLKSMPHILGLYGLTHYFSEIITNYGKIKSNGDMDLSYKGMNKTDGAIYKKLARDLLDIGIKPSQALIIGDRPTEDVEKAKENGFKAIQFTGIMKRKVSKAADYVISDLRELKKIL